MVTDYSAAVVIWVGSASIGLWCEFRHRLDLHVAVLELPLVVGVVPGVSGTLRDSVFLVSGLLEQETPIQPTEVRTDTGA